MQSLLRTLASLALLLGVLPLTASAQEAYLASSEPVPTEAAVDSTVAEPAEEATEGAALSRTASARQLLFNSDIRLQHFTPYDQRGVNVFETSKLDNTPFTGFRLRWGGAFAQQMQALSHENAPRIVEGADANALEPIGTGFNTAAANLYLERSCSTASASTSPPTSPRSTTPRRG